MVLISVMNDLMYVNGMEFLVFVLLYLVYYVNEFFLIVCKVVVVIMDCKFSIWNIDWYIVYLLE